MKLGNPSYLKPVLFKGTPTVIKTATDLEKTIEDTLHSKIGQDQFVSKVMHSQLPKKDAMETLDKMAPKYDKNQKGKDLIQIVRDFYKRLAD